MGDRRQGDPGAGRQMRLQQGHAIAGDDQRLPRRRRQDGLRRQDRRTGHRSPVAVVELGEEIAAL